MRNKEKNRKHIDAFRISKERSTGYENNQDTPIGLI